MAAAPLTIPMSSGASVTSGSSGSGAYQPVADAGSPCSAASPPTAREIRLEFKDTPSDSNVVVAEAIPVAKEPGQPPARSLCRRVCLGVCACVCVTVVALAAVAALMLIRVQQAPETRSARFTKVSSGSCSDHGYIAIETLKQCSAAARELGLEDTSVSEVPVDAIDVPEDCYYMIEKQPEHKEKLWLNKNKQQAPAKLRSLRSAPAPEPVLLLDVSRERLCEVPASHQHAQLLLAPEKKEDKGAAPWPVPKKVPTIPEAVDAVESLIFGTTTTTMTTTSTVTITGTTSTLTTTTKSTTTTTQTSTSSTTWTSTSTTMTTSTSTWTTTYHTVPSLFCFSVMRVNSYELNNVRTALAKGTSIFACDESLVFSDQEYTIYPGVPQPGLPGVQDVQGIPAVQTTLLRHDLATQAKQGSLEGILNTQIFMQAWKQLDEMGSFRQHDWVIKIDPDAVFLPDRLQHDLAKIAPASSAPNLYLVNCKISFGLFGAVEVFSRVALEKYIAGEQRCKNELDWTMMGEDLWMRKCFDLLGVQHEDDFNLLSDGYCSDKPSPCVSGKVTFHPFKDALSYMKCYTEAMTTTTSTTSTTTTETSTTRTKTKAERSEDEEKSEFTVEDDEESGSSRSSSEHSSADDDLRSAFSAGAYGRTSSED